jgi:peptidoglycan lytic transglycosylase
MLISALTLAMSGCASRNKPATPGPAPAPAPVSPRVTTPAPRTSVLEMKQGLASYYGPGFEGKLTASGARFDANSMVAAHPKYPFGTVVRVTNLSNNRAVIVRVVDRGPTKPVQDEGVLIDLSSGAARNLGFTNKGRTRVKLEVLRWGD